MGGIGSKLSQPFRNWNVESRAHRVISQKKPKSAPTYETTQKQIELVNKLEPDYTEKAQKKDPQLDDYLKKVYVTSKDSAQGQELDQISDPDRPLPKDRLLHEGFEFGFYEPREIKPGRVSLRQAVEFIANHKKEPEKYTAEYIAAQYKLDNELVENILSYYNIYTVYNKIQDHNQDIVLSHIPISLRTGLQVRYTEEKNDEETMDEYQKKLLRSSFEPKTIEEEKKKLT